MPAPVRNEYAAEAGRKLRQLREDKKWVLRDVENESIRRYGEEGAIRMAQLSRIEKGQFDRVSLDDAVRLGALYGMNPTEVASLYGLWTEGPSDHRPQAIQDAEILGKTLPEDIRQEHLQWIEFANMQARAKARERLRERHVPATAALAYEDGTDAPMDPLEAHDRQQAKERGIPYKF